MKQRVCEMNLEGVKKFLAEKEKRKKKANERREEKRGREKTRAKGYRKYKREKDLGWSLPKKN